MNNQAFTIIELLVVTAIIALLTSLVFANYRVGDRQLALERASQQLAQDLRRAQELAVSAKEFGGGVPAGYGIYFDLDDIKHYILFADLNGDQAYSDSGEKVQEITLEGTVKIIELQPVSAASSLTVVFIPPDPVTVFDPVASFAMVTLGAGGTEHQASQYTYNYAWDIWGWSEPRAACDTSDETGDCPASFSAAPSDPWYVYDWFIFFGIYEQSRKYQKETAQVADILKASIQVNQAGLIAVSRALGDQCDATADCNDGNLCTNDWCERPGDEDSVCHNDVLADGFDCGDCRQCQSGACTYSCSGTENSCQCLADACTDCSLQYGEACGYEACAPNERPSWQCSAGNCIYSCVIDPPCDPCYGAADNTQVPGCDEPCQACQSGICSSASAGTDPGNDCGTTACYTGSCDGAGACAYYTSGEHNCPTCQTCQGTLSGNCVNIADETWDSEGVNLCNTACKVCSSGACSSKTTNWGTGLYTCPAGDATDPNRCLAGSCINCGGWGNAGYCWYNTGATGISCTTACSSRGGVYNGNCDWVNDPTNCSTISHWYSCSQGCNDAAPGPLRWYGVNPPNQCSYHRDGYSWCDDSQPLYIRICACNQ